MAVEGHPLHHPARNSGLDARTEDDEQDATDHDTVTPSGVVAVPVPAGLTLLAEAVIVLPASALVST